MSLSNEELNDIRQALSYYMRMHISINNPRYKQFQLILEKLQDINENLS